MASLILLTPETCEVFGREGRSGRVFVDGKPEFELEDIVLRDRIQLSEDGIVVPIVVLHSDAGEDKSEPAANSQEDSRQQLEGSVVHNVMEGGSTENDSQISNPPDRTAR